MIRHTDAPIVAVLAVLFLVRIVSSSLRRKHHFQGLDLVWLGVDNDRSVLQRQIGRWNLH